MSKFSQFIYIVIFFLNCLPIFAQDTPSLVYFEGVIKYEIKVKSKVNVKFEHLFAKHLTLMIKDNRVLCRFDSSGVDSFRLGDILVHGDSNSIYRFLPEMKLIQRKKLSHPHPTDLVYPPEVYKPLDRKERVAGYMCGLFTSEFNLPMSGGKAKVITSCADDLVYPIKGNLIEQATILMLGAGLKGIPLKKIIQFEELETELVMKAVEVIKTPLNDKMFEIPQKVRIETFDRSFPY